MRILHITHRLPPDGVGGVERYVQGLAAAQASAGAGVAVLTRTPRRWPRRAKLVEDPPPGVRVFRIRGAGVRLEEFLVGASRTEELAARVLDDVQPDVVHVHHLIGISPRVVPAAQRAGAAVVLTLHDYYFPCPLVHLTKRSGAPCSGPDEGRECARTCFEPEGRAAARWLLRYRYFAQLLVLPERVLCPNADVADRVRAMAPRARVEISPLGTGVTARPRESRGRQAGVLRVGFFGTVAPHKGLDVLLDALAQASSQAELVVAGPSPDDRYRRSLALRAEQHGLSVEWHGAYDAGDLPMLLGGVDAVIAPSQVPEVFPLAVREALAHGVPVVAARQPGLADVVVDEVNGLLFAPGDAAELAACVHRLAGSGPLLERLRAGVARTPLVSTSEHVLRLMSLYSEVVGGRRSNEEPRDKLDGLHHEALAAGFARSSLLRERRLRIG